MLRLAVAGLLLEPASSFVCSVRQHVAASRHAGSRAEVQLAGFGKRAAKAEKTGTFKGKETFTEHMRAFASLSASTPPENKVDVYVRAPQSTSKRFWYVGKVLASVGTCDAASAVILQKRLIFEHAKLLQLELRMAKELQLWTAPINTEVRVAEHRQPLTSVDDVRVPKDVRAAALDGPRVGFEPEQYADEKMGFYVRLQEDGSPAPGSEVQTRFVTPENLGDELEKEGDKEVVALGLNAD